jgi:secernin
MVDTMVSTGRGPLIQRNRLMRCDMVVAVAGATASADTLFGHNCALASPQKIALHRSRGRAFCPGETVRTQFLELPQSRNTCTAVGAQPEGCWGYVHGINEYGLAVGCVPLPPKLSCLGPGLLGTDLVRLALERCRSAPQAIDLIASHLQRFGRAAAPGLSGPEYDPAFLVADPCEAFAVESAGGYWVEQEIGAVRAVSEVRVIRQDWDRIAPGLAEFAIQQKHWPADGTKLDFAGALDESSPQQAPGWRRWGRATLLLEQQNGHIDVAYLRRALSDHDDVADEELRPGRTTSRNPLCMHSIGRNREQTALSFVAQLHTVGERLPSAWWAFGPPCRTVYLPIFLHGDLPDMLTATGPESIAARIDRVDAVRRAAPQEKQRIAEEFSRLQARFDQDAEEFSAEGAALRARDRQADLQRLAGAFIQHVVERLDGTMSMLLGEQMPATVGSW